MSDKPSTKRGILSSLMGLFGDDAQTEAEEQRDDAATNGERSSNGAAESAADTAVESAVDADSPTPGVGGNVVRESYEPGWYAVSTARTQRPSFVSDPWLEGQSESKSDEPAEAEPVDADLSGAAPSYGVEQPTAYGVEQPTAEATEMAPPVTDWSTPTMPEFQGQTPGAPVAYSEPHSFESQYPAEPMAEEPVLEETVAEPVAESPVRWGGSTSEAHAEELEWAEPVAKTPAEEQSWAEPVPEETSIEPVIEAETEPVIEAPVEAPTWAELMPETPAEEQPWAEPVAETAVEETAWAEAPADDTPWAEPVAETAVEETAWAEAPADDTPWAEPVAEVEVEETAWAEAPADDTPWAEPVGEVEHSTPEPGEMEPAAADSFEAEASDATEASPEAVDEETSDAGSFDDPMAEEPSFDEPVAEEPVFDEPVVGEPVFDEPVVEEPSFEEPQFDESVVEEPAFDEPEPEAPEVDEVPFEAVDDASADVSEPEEAAAPAAESDDADLSMNMDVEEPVADVAPVVDEELPAEGAEEPEPVEVSMPAPEPELATVPAAPAPEENAGLLSRAANDRRRTLEEIVARGMTDDDVPAVAGLLQDPERGIRVAALDALQSRADAVDASVVRQALRDPSDEVRAGAVRLAAGRSGRDVPEVFAMVAERQWPASQQAALESVPRAISSFGIGDDDLDAMLFAVAGMDSEPNVAERSGFAALGHAVGPERLSAAMDSIGERPVGAARLLMQEGSTTSLRALAAYARDPEPEVARLGRAAADQLGPDSEEPAMDGETEKQAAEDEEQSVESFEAELGPQGEMVSGLARALGDPDEAVRDRAADALRAMDRGTLVNWALAAMGSNDPAQVELGAQVAEATGLSECAAELLARGAAESAEARGPFARAIASFNLSSEELVDLVNEMDGQHKPEGVRMLWGVGGRSLLPAVQPLLEDSSAAVRVAALEVFGESGDAQTIEIAQRVLERDSSPVVRATAISVIGRAGLDQRAASLAQALADPDPDVRATAVEVLPAGMGRQAADLLLEALSDADERVWQAAIRHLASVPDRDRSIVWQAIERCPAQRREHLVATLERTSAERLALLALDHLPSPDAAERTLAITLAGRAGTPECVRGIVQSLQDPAPTVRRTAASALLTLRSGESIAGLSRALSDPDVEVRVEAVRALSVIDDDNVLDPLITALKDPEMRVRDVAGEALVRWRSPAVARRLAIALTNPSLRRPAGEVLARMGTSAVDPLVDILMEDDSELAGTVGHLLESLVGPDIFLTRLGSMDPSERLRAVEALGAIKGERGVDGLIRALSDPVESIRVRAVGLLGEIGDERAFEAVKQAFLGDPVLEVVSAAEEALKRLQSGSDPGAAR